MMFKFSVIIQVANHMAVSLMLLAGRRCGHVAKVGIIIGIINSFSLFFITAAQ